MNMGKIPRDMSYIKTVVVMEIILASPLDSLCVPLSTSFFSLLSSLYSILSTIQVVASPHAMSSTGLAPL